MEKIESLFVTDSSSVFDFFHQPGTGLYIPLYQRDYSWDSDNIEQLIDDVAKGVEFMLESDDEIRFLGTIITVSETNPNNIQPQDKRGLPGKIRLLIDGQQRLTTISIFACVLYSFLSNELNKLNKLTIEEGDSDSNTIITELNEATEWWKKKLQNIFSLDLERGEPTRKPKIIRQDKDKWILEGDLEDAYTSDLSHYLASFIDYVNGKNKEPKIGRSTQLGKNIAQLRKWLIEVSEHHYSQENDEYFFPAWMILPKVESRYLWSFERPSINVLIENEKTQRKNKGALACIACSFVQVFSVAHYLLDRCCFTAIEPTNEKWAFDMFQSLNATGTPLTAIETFKPLVINTVENSDESDGKGSFKGSKFDTYFQKVEFLFNDSNSANQKNRRTNDFLASFSTNVSGKAVSSHFSKQRQWLEKTFTSLNRANVEDGFRAQGRFIKFLGNYAKFYKDVWINYDGKNDIPLESIMYSQDAQLISILLLFLKESNHKMAITILATFYQKVLENEENAIQEFSNAVKLISAFYIIWRSAQSNSGLDKAYRGFLKGIKMENGEEYLFPPQIWPNSYGQISLNNLKDYISYVLENEEIHNKELWVRKARNYVSYKSKKLAKFLLYIASNNSIPDPKRTGLIKSAQVGYHDFLDLQHWNSPDINSIEHIAPQKVSPNTDWDSEIYSDDEFVNSIGNLTLLPLPLNISASNKGWKTKFLYYKHLSLKDYDKILELDKVAKQEAIFLASDTKEKLQSASYSHHLEAIVAVGIDGSWNQSLIEKRSNNLLEMVWDKIIPWIDDIK